MKKWLLCVLICCTVFTLSGQQFSVLYFNVWSGLSGRGIFSSKSFEQPGSREFRNGLLVDGLRSLSPTFAGLSDLNPLPDMVKAVSDATGMTAVPFGENGGIRVGIVGLPYNLYSGSALFAKKDSAIASAGITRLSGSWTGTLVYAGASKKVLVCRASVKGEEIYIALSNWTQGLYADEVNLKAFVDLNRKGELDNSDMLAEMKKAMDSQEKRLEEAGGTIDFINKLVGQSPVILMGTLGCSADSEEYRLLLKAGFRDAWGQGDGTTWDETRNTNIKAQGADLNRVGPSRDRTDYILYRGRKLRVISSRLVYNAPTYSTFPSDRFGIFSRFELTP